MDSDLQQNSEKLLVNLQGDQLGIQLKIFKGQNQQLLKMFSIVLDDNSLPQNVKTNFQSISNVCSILQDSTNYKIQSNSGLITLNYTVTFPNGFKSSLTGTIQLQQQSLPLQKPNELQSSQLQQLISSIKKQSEEEIKNLTLQVQQLKKLSLVSESVQNLKTEFEEWRAESKKKKQVQALQSLLRKQREEFYQKMFEKVDVIVKENIALKKMVCSLEGQVSAIGTKCEVMESRISVIFEEVEELRRHGFSEERMLKSSPCLSVEKDLKKQEENEENLSNSQIIVPKPMVLASSAYIQDFIISSKLITYNGINQSTQLLGSVNISECDTSSITIVKSKYNQIGFGVMDSLYSEERNSHKKPNYIMYYGWNGGVYEAGKNIKKEGSGFRGGEKVKMAVDLKKGMIKWFVGGIVEATYETEKLTDASITWAPFIRVCDKGDCIKWMID